MNKLLLSLGCVLALSSTVSSANSYNISTSNGGSCVQNESTGKSMETGINYNTATKGSAITLTYRVEFGKGSLAKINCSRLYNITVEKQQLQLDTSRLELELLKLQIKALKDGQPATVVSNVNDW